MESNIDNDQARAGLQAANESKRAAAAKFTTPWWYHLATGVVLAAAIISFYYLSPGYWVGPIVLLLVLGQLLRRAYQRRMRVWGYGVRAGRAVLWNIGIAVVGVAAILVDLYARSHELSPWVPWSAAAVMFIVSVVFGAAFDATLRRRISGRDGR
jgi:cobalamin synthase